MADINEEIAVFAYGANRRGLLIGTEESALHDQEVAVVLLDDGREVRLFTRLVIPLDVAETSWHVVDTDGQIIAGGPTVTRERMDQFAAEHPGSRVIKGIDALLGRWAA